ncbi:MAG: hypothetical protein ABEK00_03445 [Candidatus Nanohaloarchaea archaeon]
MEDLHQYKQRLETASRKIQNSSQICEENKKLAEQSDRMELLSIELTA